MLGHVFTDAHQYPRMRFGGQLYGWHEYGNYLGPLGALMIAAGFVWILKDRPLHAHNRLGLSLALTAFVLFVLMLGDFGWYSPYVLLRRLPLMSQFRLPSRYTLVFTLYALAMVAWAFSAVTRERSDEAGLRRFVAIILILEACGLAYWNRQHYGGAFPLAPLESSLRLLARPGPPEMDPETDGFGPNSPMLRAMVERNEAVLKCNEPLLLQGAVQPGRPVVLGEGDARISNVVFSPNRITFGLVSRDGGRVVFNQRYVRGWRSTLGALQIDPQTQLAYAPVPRGTAGKVAFSFVPPGLVTGAILFPIGLVGSGVLWRRTLPRAQENSST
jgi:hypothetical protein